MFGGCTNDCHFYLITFHRWPRILLMWVACELLQDAMPPKHMNKKGLQPASTVSAPEFDLGKLTRHGGQLRCILAPSVLIVTAAAGMLTYWLRFHKTPLNTGALVVSSVYSPKVPTILNPTSYVGAENQSSVTSPCKGQVDWLTLIEGSKFIAGEVVARPANREMGKTIVMVTHDTVPPNMLKPSCIWKKANSRSGWSCAMREGCA
jgi:hypothetical protein